MYLPYFCFFFRLHRACAGLCVCVRVCLCLPVWRSVGRFVCLFVCVCVLQTTFHMSLNDCSTVNFEPNSRKLQIEYIHANTYYVAYHSITYSMYYYVIFRTSFIFSLILSLFVPESFRCTDSIQIGLFSLSICLILCLSTFCIPIWTVAKPISRTDRIRRCLFRYYKYWLRQRIRMFSSSHAHTRHRLSQPRLSTGEWILGERFSLRHMDYA